MTPSMIACTSRTLREELLISKTPALAEENVWKIHTNESTFSIVTIKDSSFLVAHCCVESSCMTTGSEISSKPASDS